jgi:hypothetical protein
MQEASCLPQLKRDKALLIPEVLCAVAGYSYEKKNINA